MSTTEEFYGQVEAHLRELDGVANDLAGTLSGYLAFVDREYGPDGITENARGDLARISGALDTVRGASEGIPSVLYDPS